MNSTRRQAFARMARSRVDASGFHGRLFWAAIADCAVRALPGAPVALPLSWKELDDLESGSQFTMKDVLARLKRKKPPAMPQPQRLPRS